MNPTASDAIDTQPDTETAGQNFLDSLENFGSSALDATTATIDRSVGQMPYDPSNPLFAALRPPQAQKPASNLGGLLLIGLLIWAVAH